MKSVTFNVPDEKYDEFVERLEGLMKDCGAKSYAPKDGEFVAFGEADVENPFVGIFKVWYKGRNDKIVCYADIYGDGVLKHEEVYWNASYIRPATDEEKENLIKAMAKAGKRWNAEKQEIEDCGVYEAIRTFDDACDDLKKRADAGDTLAKDLINDLQLNSHFTQDLLAYIKLRIVVYAINDGWEPKFAKYEYRYYPWFYLYTKEEVYAMNENERRKLVGRSSYNADASGDCVCASASNTSSSSGTDYCARLSLKDRERAEYAGRQFVKMWGALCFTQRNHSAE